MSPLEAAIAYSRCGFWVVPLPGGEKGPRHRDWQKLRIGLADLPNHFGQSDNLGVILGPASSDLVDVDLDCPEVLALADSYLPATGAVFGRASNPRSHRLFFARGAAYAKFADPTDGKMLVELRARGRDGGAHLTLFPPSIAEGERREWEGELTAPAVVNAVA
jgi:hypothetical protein